jgi:Ca2+-binding RTX toxin-like protein
MVDTVLWPHEQARQSREDYADAFAANRTIFPNQSFGGFIVPTNPTWTEDPNNSRSWSSYYQSLGWLYAAEKAYKNGDLPNFVSYAKGIILDYFSTNNDLDNPSHPIVWHDGTNAFRLANVAYFYHTYFKGGVDGVTLNTAEKNILDLGLQASLESLQNEIANVDKWEERNHRFFHGMALSTYASVFGQEPTSSPLYEPNHVAFLQEGLDVVDGVFANIINIDLGVTKEQSFFYHRFNIELILSAQRNLVENGGQTLSADYTEVLQKMQEFDLLARQPNDKVAAIGDTFFDGINGISTIRALETEITPTAHSKYLMTNGSSGTRPADLLDYSDAGYVLFRPVYAWEDARDTRLIMDVSPKVVSHGHYDNTNLIYNSFGKNILIDSGGPYNYDRGVNEFGLGGTFKEKYFITSKAHNVLTVNDKSFDVDTQVNAVVDNANFSFVSAQHNGYADITITRGTLLLKPGLLVVFDTVNNASSRSDNYTLNWHFSPDAVGVDASANTQFNVGNVHVDGIFASGGTSSYEVREGEYGTDPQGWVTYKQYNAEPAPVLEVTQKTNDAWFVSAFGTSLKAADVIALNAIKTTTGFTATVTYAGETWNITLSGTSGISVTKGAGNTGGINGTAFADNLVGTNDNDTILAGDGNDTVTGKLGDDSILGGSGNDSLRGEQGNDVIRGGAGNDSILAGSDNDTIYGDDGDDYLSGFDGENFMYGGAGNDNIRGGVGNEKIWGDSGTDIIYGNIGNDSISGGAGNDTIFGDAGNDILSGNTGTDSLAGGAGADIFRFSSVNDSNLAAGGRDRVADFSRLEGDKVDLRELDITSFIGTRAFNGDGVSEVRYTQEIVGTYQRTIVTADVDGNGTADLGVQFSQALIAFTAGDFLL